MNSPDNGPLPSPGIANRPLSILSREMEAASPAPRHPNLPPVEEQPYFLQETAEIERRLRAALETPGIESFQQTRQMPAAFFENFNAALAAIDRLFDYVLAYDGTVRKVKCAKGCCNCCIDLVRGISAAEVINIYHHVRGWPDAKQIFEYLRDSAESFMDILDSKLKSGELAFAGDDPRVLEAHLDYNRLNRRCGFLDPAAGACRIYPVRPIACRFLFSLDPPETCTPLSDKYLTRETRTIHLPPSLDELLWELGKKLGFRPLNYLAGAFCGFASEVMRAKPIEVT